MIYLAIFKVSADRDTIIPPFSSKLSRSILAHISSSYAKVMESRQPFKPIRVTVLKDSKGFPLIAFNGRKTILRANEIYSFSFSTTSNDIANDLIRRDMIDIKIWNSTFTIELTSLKIVEEIEYIDSDFYRVNFITPTLLQPPKFGKMNRFLLFPYAHFFLLSIARHWNANMKTKIKLSSLKTLYYFKEIDHRIWPVTTIYDGHPIRGFWGWVLYKIEGERENIIRLLNYANYFGAGKSRSIGFGEIEALPTGFLA
ncbi:putative CRISPR-associated protein Cas6 [Sulfurisphaera tokodaii str. 7]|uniref:CRISPR-associated protein Cas6 n=1 Tax=Sulfurisphaera tokodaii (strain DSM 16993 / JCM 10545 / NBRC 100140 / 7) TaxID=273063 RepID=Q977A9_SULTO|nr:CRISPR-associated endoribonuclease Cas6 [Sulfurisphaera tokodaii]BAB64985.1 putative CRISPR-associated protein Cas6 [Sulfurisphaera tokodaii str. 7]